MVLYVEFNKLIKCSVDPLKGNIYIFDIDNTLYPFSTPYLKYLRNAIINFLHKKKKIIIDDDFLDVLGNRYGTYIEGIIREYNLLASEINEIFSNCKILKILKYDEELHSHLSKLKGRLWCFTNGPKIHAKNILEILQIEDLFEVVAYADYFMPLKLKPNPEVYGYIENILRVKNKNKIHFFDDSKSNILIARERKWKAFLIDKEYSLISYLVKLLK